MNKKIILFPLIALALMAAGCSKNTPSEQAAHANEPLGSNSIKPAMLSQKTLPQIDMGNWKEFKATGFTINYPPFLKASNKTSGKKVNVFFTDTSLKAQITGEELKADEKFVLPVSKINITLDNQPGGMEVLDSGADLERLVKISVTSPGGQNYYLQFIFQKSEKDQNQTLNMLETVRQMANSIKFK